MASDVSVCSQALLRLGADEINSFSEGSTGPLCANLFPQIKSRVESAYPWRFNTIKSELLTRIIDTPPTQYKYAYQLPPKMLNGLPRTVWDSPASRNPRSQFTDFDVFEDKLLANTEKIYVDFQTPKIIDVFPDHVTELTILAMMAVIALPVTDQQTTADSAKIEAWGLPEERGKGGYFRTAMRIDSQGHPPQSIVNYPLVTVRHGGL